MAELREHSHSFAVMLKCFSFGCQDGHVLYTNHSTVVECIVLWPCRGQGRPAKLVASLRHHVSCQPGGFHSLTLTHIHNTHHIRVRVDIRSIAFGSISASNVPFVSSVCESDRDGAFTVRQDPGCRHAHSSSRLNHFKAVNFLLPPVPRLASPVHFGSFVSRDPLLALPGTKV